MTEWEELGIDPERLRKIRPGAGQETTLSKVGRAMSEANSGRASDLHGPIDPGTGRPLDAVFSGGTRSGPYGREEFMTKDSGERERYDSGMVRDTAKGKPDYTLIDGPFLYRWAMLMVRGAVKYGRDNWRKAQGEAELLRFRASASRHMQQWLAGDDEEDHAAAVAFNLAAA